LPTFTNVQAIADIAHNIKKVRVFTLLLAPNFVTSNIVFMVYLLTHQSTLQDYYLIITVFLEPG